MHPHDTPEAKAAFEKAQNQWYIDRSEQDAFDYSFVGFLYVASGLSLLHPLFRCILNLLFPKKETPTQLDPPHVQPTVIPTALEF